ncbi:DNA-binding protein [Citricoccus sp.]|uniref:DNA-binding protein n=1 Tax=Citricoccus sp. TaxID=1978372 RepID=UPI0028BD43EF|nr:DNA-binding protein [Citricoccus sp.]
MPSPDTAQRLAQQQTIYGISLSERFGVIMTAYGLSQRSLARVLGLSAPMLSQLINAQRIKIGNPAVYERLVMLEERQDEADLARVLSEVEASEPVLTTHASRARQARFLTPDAGAGALPGGDPAAPLGGLATAEQLRATAQAARATGAADLADVLDRAAALRG